MKEITVIFRDGSDVGLGILEETGRKFHHIRFIKNAGQGGTELADKAVEVPIDEVELRDGFDYGALIDFQDRNRSILEWRRKRQVVENTVRIEAMEGVEKKIATVMRKWDKENPQPTGAHPMPGGDSQGNEPDLLEEDAEELRCATTIDVGQCELPEGHTGAHSVATPTGIMTWVNEIGDDPINTVDGNQCNSWSGENRCSLTLNHNELHDELHYVKNDEGTHVWGVGNGPTQEPTEDDPDTSDTGECPVTTRNGAVLCERETNHSGYHRSGEGTDKLQWTDATADQPPEAQEPITDFQQPVEPPTPEEAQEPAEGTLASVDDDEDMPF